jgi:hypothetical protein
LLVEDGVDVGSEALAVDNWCGCEQRGGCLCPDEPTLAKRRQLTDGDAVACDDERFSTVERPHNLAALVPKFPLRDLSRHVKKA